MPIVRDVMNAIEKIAPKRYALSFDRVGLQVGEEGATVSRGVVAMDRSHGAVEFAVANGAQILVTHHPLIFEPLASVDNRTYEGRTVLKLIRGGVNFIASHTNWDAAVGGINDTLCSIFGLQEVEAIGMVADVANLSLVFYCPAEAVEKVVDAVSEQGAGTVGAYRRCAFTSSGEGTYLRPREDGATRASEVRVEMVLPEAKAAAVVRALKRTHPYEEPAYDLLAQSPTKEQPLGRIGVLPEPITLEELGQRADALLATRSWVWGDPAKKIRRVAVVGGAADNDWIAAQRAGADAFITGEVRQHIALEASESGLGMLACGHYATEHPGSAALGERLAKELPEIQWTVFAPPPGRCGRPF